MAYLLHHLLTESAECFPERVAARFEGHSLTYAQLDQLSNQLALMLQDNGVKQGDRVGIFVHKSFASLICVFAVMKAGGVYVPLDPNAPTKRLAYISENCGIKVLLTSTNKFPQVMEIMEEGSPIRTVVFTDNEKEVSHSDLKALEVIPWSSVLVKEDNKLTTTGTIETDLAYILYTSGSTGEPKGVMISHRTILTFINWCDETFRITPEDRVTSHAPLHFDLSTFDIYVTIKAGATIVLIPEKTSVFPIRLVKLLQDEGVTVTYLVPSVLSLMVNYGKLFDHDLSNLRLILFAGEVFPIKYLRDLVAALPNPEYYNLYGPTETNVCTYYKVQSRDLEPELTQPVPIGKACENMEVFVIGDGGELINGPDEQGELWVRGSCVAQGYWGDREKSKQNFVPNPFQTNYEEVSYRTGDIVALHEDGENWVYIGRRDHMIKSRGYRIELGEIESSLYSHNGVKEAAVVAIPDELVGNRIKAFIVPMEKNGLTLKDLEIHVTEKLPRYMVPESFEFREELPKTSTGKINRPLLSRSAV
jgi:amino acid adenylation domain-containing protein